MNFVFSSQFLNDYIDHERINYIFKNFDDSFALLNVMFKLYSSDSIKDGRRIPSNWFETNEIFNSDNEGFDPEFKTKLLSLKNRLNPYSCEDFQAYILLREIRTILITGVANYIADYINFPLMSDFIYLMCQMGTKNVVKWTSVFEDIGLLNVENTTNFNHSIYDRTCDLSIMNRLRFILKVVVNQTTPPIMLFKSINFDSYCLNSLVVILTQNPFKYKETLEMFTKIFDRDFRFFVSRKRAIEEDNDLGTSKRYKKN